MPVKRCEKFKAERHRSVKSVSQQINLNGQLLVSQFPGMMLFTRSSCSVKEWIFHITCNWMVFHSIRFDVLAKSSKGCYRPQLSLLAIVLIPIWWAVNCLYAYPSIIWYCRGQQWWLIHIYHGQNRCRILASATALGVVLLIQCHLQSLIWRSFLYIRLLKD